MKFAITPLFQFKFTAKIKAIIWFNKTAMNDPDIYKYSQIINAMQTRVEIAIKNSQMECHLSYLAFGFDENGLPIDNLDEVPIKGEAYFCQECFNDDGQDFCSNVLHNATWLDISVLANRMIEVTADHREFLKDIKTISTKGNVTKARFILE